MTAAQRTALGSAGFTLLELLVTITVLSLLMTAAVGSVRMGQRTWETGIAHATTNERLRSAVELLRHQLLEVVPLASGDAEEPWLAFAGDATSVRFVAPAPRSSDIAGLLVYEFAIDAENDATGSFALNYTAFDPGDPGHYGLGVERIDLLPAHAAALDYFGLRDEDLEPDWHSDWPASEPTLPTLVRLRFAADDATRAPPDMLFPIVTEALR